MFDFSDDEIENNFVFERNTRLRKKSGINGKITAANDIERGHLSVPGNRFNSDSQVQLYTPAPSSFKQFNDVDTPTNGGSFPIFKTRSSIAKDVKLRFPPLRDSEDHPDSFFSSIKFVVKMAQFFSLLPVTGSKGPTRKIIVKFMTAEARWMKEWEKSITKSISQAEKLYNICFIYSVNFVFRPNYLSLRFRWIHWKIIYSLLILTWTGFILTCAGLRNISHGLTYDKSANLVFFGSSLAANILLLNLAANWRNMSKDFAEMEFKLYRYNYPKRITSHFKIFTCVFMTFALVEHILSRMAELKRVLPCVNGASFFGIIESFFANYYYEIFFYIPYSPWIGIILTFTQFVCTFTWNFTDLLLTLISWTIRRRFERFNKVLFKIQGQEKDYYFWRRTRIDYNELTDLTRKVDAYVQKLMLLSLGNNLYFICIQLLKGLNSNRRDDNLYEKIYFLWSVGFLIARTCFVAFTAAGINDESKEAKTVLYSVPESGYNAETRRFLTQLTTNDVALTGCKFFSITRGLILTIAGTVVTYEVILVQFNTGDNELTNTSNKTNCLYY